MTSYLVGAMTTNGRVRYVLFWGGEPVRSFRTQREAKAKAESLVTAA